MAINVIMIYFVDLAELNLTKLMDARIANKTLFLSVTIRAFLKEISI
jgi:hypothetical protein